MRTDDEILTMIEVVSDHWDRPVILATLLTRLSFSKAKPYLRPDYLESNWEQYPRDRPNLLREIYSIIHEAVRFLLDGNEAINQYFEVLIALMWLADDILPDLSKSDDLGMASLDRICTYYGWDMARWLNTTP